MICVSQLQSIVSRIAWLAGSFVDASQRGIKVLLGFCVTQLGTYQTWTEGVFHFRANLVERKLSSLRLLL
jgi:hypothetical protein